MKILHIITSTNRGGAESHLLSLASGQTRLAGNNVCVISLSPGADELDPAFASAGVRVVHIPLKNKYVPLGCILKTKAFIREFQPDVVHSHLLPANIVGGLAARLSGIAHVASKHNDEQQLNNRLWRYVHATASARCDDAVICLSDHVARYMQRHELKSENMRVVHYAFDPSLYARTQRDIRAEFGIPAQSFLVGIVARVTPQKGHSYLLSAFSRLLRDLPDARLMIVGRGDSTATLDEVHRQVAELRLENNVIFTGQRSDAYDLMAAFDVFALPSLWEGFGMVLLEASSLQVPIIASNVSAIPEVVGQDGGILTPPGDVDALYTALRSIHDDLPDWKQRAYQHKERMQERFSLQKLVFGTQDVYKSVLKQQ